jgi:hypothetical protein
MYFAGTYPSSVQKHFRRFYQQPDLADGLVVQLNFRVHDLLLQREQMLLEHPQDLVVELMERCVGLLDLGAVHDMHVGVLGHRALQVFYPFLQIFEFVEVLIDVVEHRQLDHHVLGGAEHVGGEVEGVPFTLRQHFLKFLHRVT